VAIIQAERFALNKVVTDENGIRRKLGDDGYVWRWVKEHPRLKRRHHWMHEHIIATEEKLGRRLRPGEYVHHKNGDKWDNSPDNLQIVSKSQHVKIHEKKRIISGWTRDACLSGPVKTYNLNEL
jgi:hypothetical protein